MIKNILAAFMVFIFISLSAQENKNIKQITPQSKSTNTEIKKNEQKYTATQSQPQNAYTVSTDNKLNTNTVKAETKISENGSSVMSEQQYNDLIAALEGKLKHVKSSKSEYKKAKQSGWVKNTETEINRLRVEKNALYHSKKREK